MLITNMLKFLDGTLAGICSRLTSGGTALAEMVGTFVLSRIADTQREACLSFQRE